MSDVAEWRKESRHETVNRIMNEMLNDYVNMVHHFGLEKITDEEASIWEINNASLIRTKLEADPRMHKAMLNLLFSVLMDEIKHKSERITRMHELASQLWPYKLAQDKEERERKEDMNPPNGGFRRRNNKHSKKTRKTKSRRH
jgi:hypothetical protein